MNLRLPSPAAPLAGIFAALLLSPGFAADPPPRLVEDLSWGDVGLKLEASPVPVDPAGSLEVTLTVDAPSRLQVTLPDLRARLQGFSSAESFLQDPVSDGGRKTTVQRWILAPAPAAEYRLAPFAVEVRDNSSQPPAVSWFATRPVVFEAADPGPAPEGEPEVDPEAQWIPPTLRAIATWAALAALGAALLALLVWLATRLRRRIVERRMSPRERALAELDRLVRRGLVERGLYKDFYVGLTRVVRRYIERAHAIRAAELTTEEFLAAALGRPEFSGDVLARLRAFLESADLVKFAGVQASPRMADDATATARGYVESDAARAEAVAAAAAAKEGRRP